MVAVRPLVVVAGAEPSVTDDLADRLRETCVVRTAYSTEEVLDRLDAEVDVVLVAPGLGPEAVERVRRSVDERGLPCRIGLLDASPAGGDEDRDGDESPSGAENSPPVVDPSGTDRAVRADVEHLATLAQYRTALDEYFALARRETEGETRGDDPQNRLGYVRGRLDDVAADLDTASLFEAALHGSEHDAAVEERFDDCEPGSGTSPE